ncbi:hypothetical protein N7516_002122 [Penicillium verrucosum]|uniref:uncharacterized protein n=1 Tax=Penicillium verrucosum TaxID=60171 RepID=UPI0025457075|nr:uncharacterized protein N7516_002122 [Penicillium verrucosum]KAJ5941954.1 hypothetical protein N7516_002122 [Penicillium verrucosum]
MPIWVKSQAIDALLVLYMTLSSARPASKVLYVSQFGLEAKKRGKPRECVILWDRPKSLPGEHRLIFYPV